MRWPDLPGLGADRYLDRVVVAVVTALDLDDQVAAGDRAHQVDGVHGRLGARVGEPPERQPEPPGQLLGHQDRRWRRLAKCVPSTAWPRIASTIAGCPCPARAGPYPPCRSAYSLPSRW